MKNRIADVLEEESIIMGMTQDEVKWYFGKEPDISNSEEWIYFIEKYFFGIMTRKLHLYFHKGHIRDFYIG